jgi:hypothetical protein
MAAHFREAQQFRQPLLWAATLAVSSTSTAYTVGILFEKFVLGALAPRPVSVTMQMFVALAATGVLWALTAVLFSARLLVLVEDDAIVLRYTPFTREVRVEAWRIRSAVVHSYRPFSELGGWGIRSADGTMSYTVSGQTGVLLHLDDGQRVLIGSRRPLALIGAIQKQIVPAAEQSVAL